MAKENSISRNGLTRLAGFIKTAWLISGIVVISMLALELTSTLLLSVYHALAPFQDQRVHADAYENEDWPDAYFDELRAASVSRWKPYVYWRRAPFSGKYIHVDQNGLRWTGRPKSKTEQLNIFVFGGSAVWGNGVRDAYTIPALIEQKLSKMGVENKVTNFGEDGYVSTQETIELILQLQQGNVPDIVVFYDGVNDTFSGLQNGMAGLPQNEWNREQAFALSKPSGADAGSAYFLLRALRETNTVRILHGVMRRIGSDQPISYRKYPAWRRDVSDIETDVINTYFANINLVTALGREHGFKTVFFWQPAVYTKSMPTAYEAAQKIQTGKEMEHMFVKTYALMKQTPFRFQYNFINLSDIFADMQAPVFLDIFHVSEKGNEIITDRMIDDLMKLINPAR